MEYRGVLAGIVQSCPIRPFTFCGMCTLLTSYIAQMIHIPHFHSLLSIHTKSIVNYHTYYYKGTQLGGRTDSRFDKALQSKKIKDRKAKIRLFLLT